METMIGSARIDENGHTTGGKAGDQTGREVGTQVWYLHSKGWDVFRPKSAVAAAKIAKAGRASCDNNRIGYDQAQRNTLWNQVKDKGFDPAKATVKCETDCSALVRLCCAYAGIVMPDFNTSSEAAALKASKAFVQLTASKYSTSGDYLRKGDILVTKSKGHTVIVLSDGAKAGSDGWMYTEEADKKTPEADVAKGVVKVGTGSWYIRATPGRSGRILGTVHCGDKLHCTEVKDGWCHVWGDVKDSFGNRVRVDDGWISMKGIADK